MYFLLQKIEVYKLNGQLHSQNIRKISMFYYLGLDISCSRGDGKPLLLLLLELLLELLLLFMKSNLNLSFDCRAGDEELIPFGVELLLTADDGRLVCGRGKAKLFSDVTTGLEDDDNGNDELRTSGGGI